MSTDKRKLTRQLGLMALTATGVCSMLGASINVVPFMIQRNVPGIGPYVLYAFALAAVPALLAAFCYGMLASAMPRAGGSYLYASRGLNPYLGFIASFSQWFGLSIVIGVIAYIIVPFIRDVIFNLGFDSAASMLDDGWIRVPMALLLIWLFIWVNYKGAKSYAKTLLPMMYLMFALGAIVIVSGFIFNYESFLEGLRLKDGRIFEAIEMSEPGYTAPFGWKVFLSAAAILFSSFIGFDSIAQAGGEAKNPGRNLPAAILLAILGVGTYYFLFTSAVYHTVPWSFVAAESGVKDISAPGLLSYVLPASLGVLIIAGAAIALINDLPAMLLSVSRLMFAWAEDKIFPERFAEIHPTKHTPANALIFAGIMASIGVLGSHFAGDFFLGIDIMVTSMMVNFLLMCVTIITIKRVNPELSSKITMIQSRALQLVIGWTGIIVLTGFLIIHVFKDLTSDVDAWYFHSTYIWLIIMTLASILFINKWSILKRNNPEIEKKFKLLPEE